MEKTWQEVSDRALLIAIRFGFIMALCVLTVKILLILGVAIFSSKLTSDLASSPDWQSVLRSLARIGFMAGFGYYWGYRSCFKELP